MNAFALTPGLVSTSIKDPMEESIGLFSSLLYYPFIYLIKFLFAKTAERGAQTSIFCAIQPDLEISKDIYFQSVLSVEKRFDLNGFIFRNCSPCKSSPLSVDPVAVQQLWKISSQALRL